MSITLGLDLAKHTSWYAAVAENDQLIEDGRIPSNRGAFARLVQRFNPDLVLLEASSITAWAVDALIDAGAEVWPVHPGSLPPRRQRRKKTDRVDARQLVRLYRGGVLTKAWIPPKHLRDLRNLARARHRLAEDRSIYRNRIHSALNQEGERIHDDHDDELEGPKLFTKRGRSATLDAHPELSGWFELQDLLATHMKTLDKRILEVSAGIPEISLLRTIPGFGPLVGLAFYAELGNIERFRNAEQVVAYLGLDPVVEQSGDMVKHLGISHKGSGWVRGVLTQGAWAHVTHAKNSHVTHKHHALAKRVGKKKAIVASCRRLAKVGYWVWRDQVPFESSGRTPRLTCRHVRQAA